MSAWVVALLTTDLEKKLFPADQSRKKYKEKLYNGMSSF